MSPPAWSSSASPDPVVARLRAAGCVFAEDEAELLISAARTPDDLEELLGRRESGLPLEQILGWAQFCGLRIAIEPGVFVPRRRTEFLVDHAVALAPDRAVVLDLCCGTGALGAAVLARRGDVELYAADVDAAAVRCARRNVAAAVAVFEGDLYEPLPERLRGRVDVLLANAPYVPSAALATMPPEARLHEPAIALDGGPDGLYVLRRVFAGAPQWLAPGGHVLAETSDVQAPHLASFATDHGLASWVEESEERGATVVIGRRRA